jgi:hypothetical protein
MHFLGSSNEAPEQEFVIYRGHSYNNYLFSIYENTTPLHWKINTRLQVERLYLHLILVYYLMLLVITEAARSHLLTAFTSLNTGMLVSNPTGGMVLCVFILRSCCPVRALRFCDGVIPCEESFAM